MNISSAGLRNTLVGVVVGTLTVALVTSCSSSDSTAKSESTSTTTVAGATTIDSAGGGEVENVGAGLGTEANPINSRTMLRAFDGTGHPGALVVSSDNICDSLQGLSGPHQYSQSGVDGVYFDVMLLDRRQRVGQATLACSTGKPQIGPNSNGPGTDGVSVACPAHAPFAVEPLGGVAFTSASSGQSIGNVTQTAGSNGPGMDGLWNYKFQNSNSNESVVPTVWLVCANSKYTNY